MNSKKMGFSLIELLAVIVILGVIISLASYSFISYVKSSKAKIDSISDEVVFKAANSYITEKLDDSLRWLSNGTDSEYTCVMLKSLIDKGYFKDSSFTDVEKKKKIKITRNSSFTVINTNFANDDDKCDALEPKLNIKIDNSFITYNDELWYREVVKVIITDENNTNSDIDYSIDDDKFKCSSTNLCEFTVGKSGDDINIKAKAENASGVSDVSLNINVDLTNPQIQFVVEGNVLDNVYQDFANISISYEDDSMINEKLYYLNDSSINVINDSYKLNYSNDVINNNFKVCVITKSGKEVCNDENIQVKKFEFNRKFIYTGHEVSLEIPLTGYYYVDARGASGSGAITRGFGGVVNGYIKLKKGDILNINIGGSNGYNGGGTGYGGRNGGGATTLKKDNIVMITAGGGGAAGEYCFSNLDSYNPITSIPTATCIESENSASSGGNNTGGNGTNGGGGGSVFDHEDSTNGCLSYSFRQELVSKICVKYDTVRIYIPPYVDMTIPGSTCLEYKEYYNTIPVCNKYVYSYDKVVSPGEGGKSSVSSDVESVSYIHNSNYGDGILSIEYVGDSYED